MATYTLLDFINYVNGLDAADKFADVDVLVELGTGYAVDLDARRAGDYTRLHWAPDSDTQRRRAVNVFGRRLKRILLYAMRQFASHPTVNEIVLNKDTDEQVAEIWDGASDEE